MVTKKTAKKKRPSRNPNGRPKGVPNRATARVVNLLSEPGKDPVIFFACLLMGDRNRLVKEYGWSKNPTKEFPALSCEMQMHAAKKLLPHRASKPVTVENEDGDDVAATFASVMAQMFAGGRQ